jgi:hypothetical protein
MGREVGEQDGDAVGDVVANQAHAIDAVDAARR